jgi:hypothetical protein
LIFLSDRGINWPTAHLIALPKSSGTFKFSWKTKWGAAAGDNWLIDLTGTSAAPMEIARWMENGLRLIQCCLEMYSLLL